MNFQSFPLLSHPLLLLLLFASCEENLPLSNSVVKKRRRIVFTENLSSFKFQLKRDSLPPTLDKQKFFIILRSCPLGFCRVMGDWLAASQPLQWRIKIEFYFLRTDWEIFLSFSALTRSQAGHRLMEKFSSKKHRKCWPSHNGQVRYRIDRKFLKAVR